MGFGNVGRAFLLGTSALVMTSAAAVAADFDITVDTVANQVLGPAPGETGTVQAGFTLSPSNAALPTVDIVGLGATLTNLGAIVNIKEDMIPNGAFFGVRAFGPITGVSVTNSGLISAVSRGFGTAFGVANGADISGGVTNSGTIFGTGHGIPKPAPAPSPASASICGEGLALLTPHAPPCQGGVDRPPP